MHDTSAPLFYLSPFVYYSFYMATASPQPIETAATAATTAEAAAPAATTTAEAAVGARKTRLKPQVSSSFNFFLLD